MHEFQRDYAQRIQVAETEHEESRCKREVEKGMIQRDNSNSTRVMAVHQKNMATRPQVCRGASCFFVRHDSDTEPHNIT